MAARATKVVFVTQHFDPDHPALGTTISQLTALARRVDRLVIVADTIVPGVLPPNARAWSFRAPTKLGRGLRFYAALLRELPGLRGGAVIAHMCPVYAVLAAPLVRPAGVPLLLWYTHWKDHWVVRAAERVCTAVVSVDARSFPFASRKLVATGQAIEVDHFPERRAPAARSGPLRVVVAGRYSPAKGLETVLRATRRALDSGIDLRVELHGPAFNDVERDYRARLEPLVDELRLRDHVVLGDAVGRNELPRLLARSDVLVNNARGGADRIVYEAAASGIPVLASNPAHENLLEPDAFFGHEDSAALAERLAGIAALSPAERIAVGRALRERVLREHSVDSWSRGLLAAAGYGNA
jgi:glycosyltransferase involved in cell wall biosynthesis